MLKTITVLCCSVFLLSGCASKKIAVTTLESTIEQSAIAVKSASKGSVKTVDIEVAVVTAVKGSGTIPVPYVPIGVDASSSTTTKLKVTVNLEDFPETVAEAHEDSQVYILDLNTGVVTPAP